MYTDKVNQENSLFSDSLCLCLNMSKYEVISNGKAYVKNADNFAGYLLELENMAGKFFLHSYCFLSSHYSSFIWQIPLSYLIKTCSQRSECIIGYLLIMMI